jgi:hypothetical protein
VGNELNCISFPPMTKLEYSNALDLSCVFMIIIGLN